MPNVKKRAASFLLALCTLLLCCCAPAEPPTETPPPAEGVLGTPLPSATPVPTPSPSTVLSPILEPDFPEGPVENVLPPAESARYLKNGLPYTCPHGTQDICNICLSDGALPLPDENRLTAILRYLTAQSRLTGSEHCESSGDFIQNALFELGYEPVSQSVSTDNTGHLLSGESALAFGETVLSMDYVFGSAQGVRQGRAIFCGDGYPLPESAEGAVLIANGASTLSAIAALGLGTPAGVVLVNTEKYFADTVPALWPDAVVLATDDAKLFDLVKSGDILTISSTENGPFASENLIAVLNPGAKETIILCAHYDSVSTSPGANDNAAGVALLLELARVFSEVETNDRVVFLFTTGEEQGMLGSWVYTRELSKEEQSSIRAVFALDMFADKNQGMPLIYTCNGEPDAAVSKLLLACDQFRLQKPLLGKEFRSDHAPFYGIGLPAALIAQSESDELYHTPYDTMDKLSSNIMDLVFAWNAGILLHSTN